MSVKGLLLRFACIYIALMLGVAVVFNVLDVKANSGVNAGALMGSVIAVCMWFSRKNRRYLEPTERRQAFLGMWAIDIAFQALVSVGFGVATDATLPPGPMLFALAFVGILNGAGIYLMIVLGGRQYAKQVDKGA